MPPFVNLHGGSSTLLPVRWLPGERPDYTLIMRYVNNIADLYIRYAEKIIHEQLPALQTQIENNQQVLGEEDVPRNMQGQPDALRIWAIEVALSSEEGKSSMIPFSTGCGQRCVMTALTLTKSWRRCCRCWKN